MNTETSGREHTQPGGWSRTARALHWGLAAAIFTQLAIGWYADRLPISPEKIDWMTGHKSLGLTILAFVLLRAWRRWRHGRPPEVDDAPWAHRASRIGHAALYILMFAVPLSGWLAASASRLPWKLWWWLPMPHIDGADETLRDLAGETHELLMYALVAVIALHVLAALRHHFVLNNRALKRMWSGR